MSHFLPSILRPVHLEEAQPESSQSQTSSKAKKLKLSWDEEQYQHQIPAPHLPGEGRFQITAKVGSK